MTPRAQATRMALAVDRLVGAGQRLATVHHLDGAGLTATHRDPALQLLFRLEALVTVLEAIPAPLASVANQAGDSEPAESTARRRK